MREQTPVDRIAEDHTRRFAELDPLTATAVGIPGFDHLMTDLSPAGHAARADLDRQTLAALDTVEPVDAVDEVTVAAMRDRLGLSLEIFEAGEYRADLNNIASPLQGLRDVLDVMPTTTSEHWAAIASRLARVPEAVDGYIACLREGMRDGLVPAALQVREGVHQASELADPTSSYFVTFTGGARPDDAAPSPGLAADLDRAGQEAAAAYGRLVGFLRDELAPLAPEQDAVGRDRYGLFSRLFVGATIDLDETYEWGVEELARITAEQEALARDIAGPDAGVAEAVAALDADPGRTLHGTAALKEWMQVTADDAIARLDGVHFDIPEQVRRIECLIAPTQNGGIYYTGPSDDWTRPGRMWWSVPPGVESFNTWREKTTVYHEGVPGHHLQIGQAVYNAAELNTWRRLICWMSGHGEGWALYAERLMEEFGFLDDPGDRFGMLDAQRLRATRVVLDLGVHLRKPALAPWGEGTWDRESAWRLLKGNVNMDDGFLRFELNRYLGWPGQAPSYKVGQRLWQQTRADAARAATAGGEEFSLKEFHTRALNLGSVPLDVLRTRLGGGTTG